MSAAVATGLGSSVGDGSDVGVGRVGPGKDVGVRERTGRAVASAKVGAALGELAGEGVTGARFTRAEGGTAGLEGTDGGRVAVAGSAVAVAPPAAGTAAVGKAVPVPWTETEGVLGP